MATGDSKLQVLRDGVWVDWDGDPATTPPSDGLTDAQLRASAVPVADGHPDPQQNGLTDAQLRASAVPVATGLNPLTDAQLRASAVTVSGPLTDAQLRAAAVPVSGPLTDAQLRATSVPVATGLSPLTDAQLRAAAVPVSGPLTDAQLRAAAVPVSGPLTDSQLRASPVAVTMASAFQLEHQAALALDANGEATMTLTQTPAGVTSCYVICGALERQAEVVSLVGAALKVRVRKRLYDKPATPTGKAIDLPASTTAVSTVGGPTFTSGAASAAAIAPTAGLGAAVTPAHTHQVQTDKLIDHDHALTFAATSLPLAASETVPVLVVYRT